jgi:hypothetical protein
MATLKPIPPYRVATIEDKYVNQCPGVWDKYADAYKQAMKIMKQDESVNSMLIFSKNTAMVIKRKWLK